MWIAGIAVILFSAAGIAAIMGWIPTSMGHSTDNMQIVNPDRLSANTEKPAIVKTEKPAAVKPHSAPVRGVPMEEAPVRGVPMHDAAPVQTAASSYSHPRCAECGVIESTRSVEKKGEGSGVGVVGGAVLGGLLGNQVGAGRGNTVATAIGAVGGAMAGNEVEKRVQSHRSYEVTVRLDDGSRRVISEATAPTWRAGDHVRVVDGVIRSNS